MKIDEKALYQTKKICHHELDEMIFKYNKSHIQIFLRFIKKEFYHESLFALVGLIVVFMLSLLAKNVSVFCVGGYFFILGAVAIYEHLKNEIYHMNDLMKMAYLNEGKTFLFRTITMSLYQIIAFVVLCLFLSLDQFELISCIFYALLPIYVSQIISFHMMSYIKNSLQTFIVYILSYFLIIYIFHFYEINTFVTLRQSIIAGISVIVLFVIDMIFVYKQRKGNHYGISY